MLILEPERAIATANRIAVSRIITGVAYSPIAESIPKRNQLTMKNQTSRLMGGDETSDSTNGELGKMLKAAERGRPGEVTPNEAPTDVPEIPNIVECGRTDTGVMAHTKMRCREGETDSEDSDSSRVCAESEDAKSNGHPTEGRDSDSGTSSNAKTQTRVRGNSIIENVYPTPRVKYDSSEPKQKTITFQPEKLGFSRKGRKVATVSPGTQAASLGVKSDWFVVKIAGEAVTDKTIKDKLRAVKDTGKSFSVEFLIQE